jgi:acetylornithine aminotransferase
MIPDVMTLAKSLGNGVPIGACIAGGRAAEILQPGNHGSTFGGNPLASRAALAVLDVMETEDICERAAVLAEILTAGFTSRLATLDGVVEIRNKGLMIGIELETPCGSLVKQALDAGVLINVTADTVVRLLPPLVMSDEEAEQLLDLVCPLITRFCAATH